MHICIRMSTLWLSFAFKAAEYYAERWQLPLGRDGRGEGKAWGKLPPLCDSNLCTSNAMLRIRVDSTTTENSTLLRYTNVVALYRHGSCG